MSIIRSGCENIWNQLNRLTLVERLICLVIVAIVIAFLIPGPQWASDGDIEVSVRVQVFDSARATPIAQARVAIIYMVPWAEGDVLKEFRERFSIKALNDHPATAQAITDANGIAEIPYRFTTSASHKRPAPHAHTWRAWVVVQAKGYGGVAIPVRNESVPTSEIRKEKALRVPVGLLPVELK